MDNPNSYDDKADEPTNLTSSGKWGDIPHKDDSSDHTINNHKGPVGALTREILAKESGQTDEDDRFEAPVLWIKRAHRASEAVLKENILNEFKKLDMNDVEIVHFYITNSGHRDHAYLVLNSKKASDMLLDSSINVSVTHKNEDGEDDSSFLWFEKADHLVPRENQDPFTLYIWQLPTGRPAEQIKEELYRWISPLSPIIDIEIGNTKTRYDEEVVWAKVSFQYEFDTQKCVYLLNFNRFMGHEVRAGFCNTDRNTVIRKTPPDERTRRSNPRPKGSAPGQYSGKSPKNNHKKEFREQSTNTRAAYNKSYNRSNGNNKSSGNNTRSAEDTRLFERTKQSERARKLEPDGISKPIKAEAPKSAKKDDSWTVVESDRHRKK